MALLTLSYGKIRVISFILPLMTAGIETGLLETPCEGWHLVIGEECLCYRLDEFEWWWISCLSTIPHKDYNEQ